MIMQLKNTTNAPDLTEDVILGLDRTLSFHRQAIDEVLAKGGDPEAMKDLTECLHAAQAWLMIALSGQGHHDDDPAGNAS